MGHRLRRLGQRSHPWPAIQGALHAYLRPDVDRRDREVPGQVSSLARRLLRPLKRAVCVVRYRWLWAPDLNLRRHARTGWAMLPGSAGREGRHVVKDGARSSRVHIERQNRRAKPSDFDSTVQLETQSRFRRRVRRPYDRHRRHEKLRSSHAMPPEGAGAGWCDAAALEVLEHDPKSKL